MKRESTRHCAFSFVNFVSVPLSSPSYISQKPFPSSSQMMHSVPPLNRDIKTRENKNPLVAIVSSFWETGCWWA